MSSYESDFHAWTHEQARLIRQGRWPEADAAHLAEEIESLGKTIQQQLESRLSVLLLHLLKWQFQPGLRGNSWRLTIKEQRRRIARLIRQNPSLKHKFAETLADAYGDALIGAERETGLPETTFPSICPWTYNEMTDDGFWPGTLAD